MIDVVTAENRSMFTAFLDQVWVQRYKVFVEKLGWDLPKGNGAEIDEFDREDTVYLIATDDKGTVTSSLRLIPTETPHLMSEVFADLVQGDIPRGPSIWEVSRFYVWQPGEPIEVKYRTSVELMCGLMELSLLLGIDQITYVTDMMTFAAMVEAGLDMTPMGAPTEFKDGGTYVAGYISVTPLSLQNAREKHNVDIPVIRFQRIPEAA